MKIAIIVHVFYPEFWKELADCIRRVDEPYDLFITYSDEQSIRDCRTDFPHAHYILSENCGYDIRPFLKVINTLDFDKYTHIIKLHTKRDISTDGWHWLNYVDIGGDKWRKRLLSFISSDKAWSRTKREIIENATVGMIADPFCVLKRDDVSVAVLTFDKSISVVKNLGVDVDFKEKKYVGGTMFIARADIFSCLKGRWHASDFEGVCDHSEGSLAHVIERVLGLCVYASDFVISDSMHLMSLIDKKIRIVEVRSKVLSYFGSIRRFLFQIKKTKRGFCLVKVLKIPVLYFRSDVPEKRLERKEERMARKMKEIVDWYDTQLRSS